MDEVFSFLSDCMPVSDQRYIEKHVPVIKTRLPGLLPSVECIPALIACMAMDSASSTNSFASAIFCGGSLCNNVLRTFPTFGAFFCKLHWIGDFWH
jgi:hypothetical protein